MSDHPTSHTDEVPPSTWLPGPRPAPAKPSADPKEAGWSSLSIGEKIGAIVLGLVALMIIGAIAGGGSEKKSQPAQAPAQTHAKAKATVASGQHARPVAAKPAAPAPWRATTASVTALVEDKLGSDNDELDVARVRDAVCGNHHCTISYVADTPIWKAEKSLLEEARPVWKGLFDDHRLRSATIITYGETTSVGGKKSVSPVMKVMCDRGSNAEIDWDAVDSHGIEALCDYRPLVNF